MALPTVLFTPDGGSSWPRSPYFRHYVRRQREKDMAENNEPPVDPKLAFCPTCGVAFLVDRTRTWSPCHGTDPQVTLDIFALVDLVNALVERFGSLEAVVLEFAGAGGADPATAALDLPAAPPAPDQADGSAPPAPKTAAPRSRKAPANPAPAGAAA
jgi:hypothetical protein